MIEKSVLFIGTGGRLTDPNFSQLLNWLGNKYKDFGARHYLLLTEGQKNPAPNTPFNIVRCADFGDQSRWLTSIPGRAAVRDGSSTLLF